MPNIPTLKPPHLILRPLQPTDADALHRIHRTEGVLQFFPGSDPPPLEKVQRFIAGQQIHWETHGYGNWGIVLREYDRDEIIGWAGLQFLPELNETEVGYLLDKPFWGKGYATEAARASIEFGFDQCAFSRLIALVHPGNIASQRVLEKCRLTYLETIHLWGIDLMRYQLERTHTQ